jgi:hypothetical protein
MTVVESGGFYVIDMTTELKTTYPIHSVLINDEEKSTVLPYTATLAVGVHTIKVLLRNNTSSYTETRCLLNDPSLECEAASFFSNSSKDIRSVTNVPYLFYILLEGTKDVNNCGCLCEDLKNIYQDIKDEIYGISC